MAGRSQTLSEQNRRKVSEKSSITHRVYRSGDFIKPRNLVPNFGKKNKAPTMKEMVTAAFKGCEGRTPNGGVPFKQMVAYIRANFNLTTGVNNSLEPQVVNHLNSMIRQGHVSQDSLNIGPMRGVYSLKPEKEPEDTFNMIVSGKKLPQIRPDHTRMGLALPGVNLYLTQAVTGTRQDMPIRRYDLDEKMRNPPCKTVRPKSSCVKYQSLKNRPVTRKSSHSTMKGISSNVGVSRLGSLRMQSKEPGLSSDEFEEELYYETDSIGSLPDEMDSLSRNLKDILALAKMEAISSKGLKTPGLSNNTSGHQNAFSKFGASSSENVLPNSSTHSPI